jgi:exonuclease III
MSLLCWNCRGLGSDATVGELRWLVKHFRPGILFLSETKMWDTKARNFMWSLGYTGPFAVSCEGRSGGLALFWRQPFSISLRGANSHAIDVIVDSGEPMSWRATFIYGEPRREQRHLFWDMLRRLRGGWNGPWICCGDFNEVLVQDEHYGSTDRSEAQMELF